MYIENLIVRPINHQPLLAINVVIISKVQCRFYNKLTQFIEQNTDIYRGYYVTFTLINNIFCIILMAWRKRSMY